MPHTTYWEEKGMLIEWSGVIEATEVLKSNGAVYGDKRFDSIRYQINDLRNAEYASFTEKEINIISALELQASDWNRYMKMVHVTQDPKLIADIRQYEKKMEASGWEFLICSTVAEARQWVSAS